MSTEYLHGATGAKLTMEVIIGKRDRLRPDSGIGRLLGRFLFRRAQHSAERRHFHMRRDLLNLDESVDNALAFSGQGE